MNFLFEKQIRDELTKRDRCAMRWQIPRCGATIMLMGNAITLVVVYKHKHSIWTTKITRVPGRFEKRVIAPYSFT